MGTLRLQEGELAIPRSAGPRVSPRPPSEAAGGTGNSTACGVTARGPRGVSGAGRSGPLSLRPSRHRQRDRRDRLPGAVP